MVWDNFMLRSFRTCRTRTNDGSPETDAARDQAGELLRQWGAAPLLYFALLPDKRYLLGGEADWGMAYRIVGRHAMALGDPFGDPGRCREAVSAFLDLCRRQGWRPAFYQVTPQHLDLYREAGLRRVEDRRRTRRFACRSFLWRASATKTCGMICVGSKRPGSFWKSSARTVAAESSVVAEMEAICRKLAARAPSQGRQLRDGRVRIRTARCSMKAGCFVARDSETGRMLAFATFVPIFGPEQTQGWALDLMRRRADALHGVMDFLIVSAALEFAAEGAARMSLGLSPLAGSGRPRRAGAIPMSAGFSSRG